MKSKQGEFLHRPPIEATGNDKMPQLQSSIPFQTRCYLRKFCMENGTQQEKAILNTSILKVIPLAIPTNTT
jgi:hypothetical protein